MARDCEGKLCIFSIEMEAETMVVGNLSRGYI